MVFHSFFIVFSWFSYGFLCFCRSEVVAKRSKFLERRKQQEENEKIEEEEERKKKIEDEERQRLEAAHTC